MWVYINIALAELSWLQPEWLFLERFGAVVLKLWHASKSPGRLTQVQMAGPPPYSHSEVWVEPKNVAFLTSCHVILMLQWPSDADATSPDTDWAKGSSILGKVPKISKQCRRPS